MDALIIKVTGGTNIYGIDGSDKIYLRQKFA